MIGVCATAQRASAALHRADSVFMLSTHVAVRLCSKTSAGATLRGWAIKYYKGLGTSTAAEAKEYFQAIDRHQIDFALDDPAITGYNPRTCFSPWRTRMRPPGHDALP